LDAALATGIGCFHVESAAEVEALAGLASRRETVARVAVRVNFAEPAAGSRLRMAGTSSRFGIDAEQVPAVLRTIAATPSLHLAGVHAYAGTQCFDAAAFVAHCARLCGAVRTWERELGVTLDEIDLGGGFGVPAFAGDPEFDLAAAGAGLQELVRAHDRAGRTWFVELGRYLAAPAGLYLTRVLYVKQSGGRTHAVLDGGLHHHAAATGFGTILKRAPLLVPAAEPLRAGTPVTLGGPLCTPADQFAEDLPIGPLQAGDLVAVLHAGAYGLSYSPHSFLGHPTPAEVLVDGTAARIVRDRGLPADTLRGQRL
ncbi:MAG: diaminopimelate decarboxylase, partial [Planctomycetota bacterium]